MIDRNQQVLHVPQKAEDPHEHVEELIDATIHVKDWIQIQGHDEWLKVVSIDLSLPGLRVKTRNGEPKTQVVGVAKLSGAWIKRPGSSYMFQLPRESADWGKSSLG